MSMCPAPSNSSSRAFGTSSAISRLCRSGVIASRVPPITSVGMVTFGEPAGEVEREQAHATSRGASRASTRPASGGSPRRGSGAGLSPNPTRASRKPRFFCRRSTPTSGATPTMRSSAPRTRARVAHRHARGRSTSAPSRARARARCAGGGSRTPGSPCRPSSARRGSRRAGRAPRARCGRRRRGCRPSARSRRRSTRRAHARRTRRRGTPRPAPSRTASPTRATTT